MNYSFSLLIPERFFYGTITRKKCNICSYYIGADIRRFSVSVNQCKLMMLLVFISLGGAAHQHGKEDAPVPAQVREAHGI